jgi:hypothetical protein
MNINQYSNQQYTQTDIVNIFDKGAKVIEWRKIFFNNCARIIRHPSTKIKQIRQKELGSNPIPLKSIPSPRWTIDIDMKSNL